MGIYIIQIILFQLAFWLFYEVFLRKETFFNANRAYLLTSSVLSLILPFVKLSFFSKTVPELQQALVVQLPEILIGEQETVNSTANITSGIVQLVPQTSSWFSIELFWFIGMGVCAFLLLYKLIRIYYYKFTNPNQWKGNYLLVWIQNSKEAFSFFNQIFLGDQIEKAELKSILKHEKVHANQWHSLDLLWFELLRIVFWFNPLVYIYQKRVTDVHEFIADKAASEYQENYYEDLLAQTFGVAQFSLVNQFYSSSLLKKRIIMLTKQKSNPVKLVKYLGMLPMLLVMLFYVSSIQLVSAQENVEVKKEKPTTDLDVPFAILEKSPIYPGCNENVTSEELKKCLTQKVTEFVAKEFNTKIAKENNLAGEQRIAVMFKIDKEGNIVGVKARSLHPVLKEEAIRVISSLPKMKPGMHKGKAVTVPYSLPIKFKVQDIDKNK